jgi:hypothetical protein
MLSRLSEMCTPIEMIGADFRRRVRGAQVVET